MPLELVEAYLGGKGRSSPKGTSSRLLHAESDHRIANNLTLIAGLVRLQARQLQQQTEAPTAEQIQHLLSQVESRIESVARLHRLLAEEGADEVDLSAYLADVAQAIIGAVTDSGQVQLVCHLAPDCQVTPEHAVAAGLAVGELLTNAVKYAAADARKSEVRVKLEARGDRDIVIEVADNGPGLPTGFDPQQEGGLGMRLVRTLASQLGSDLTFHQGRLGLTVRMLIPNAR